jgi:hypothetical protein
MEHGVAADDTNERFDIDGDLTETEHHEAEMTA